MFSLLLPDVDVPSTQVKFLKYFVKFIRMWWYRLWPYLLWDPVPVVRLISIGTLCHFQIALLIFFHLLKFQKKVFIFLPDVDICTVPSTQVKFLKYFVRNILSDVYICDVTYMTWDSVPVVRLISIGTYLMPFSDCNLKYFNYFPKKNASRIFWLKGTCQRGRFSGVFAEIGSA